MTQRIAPHWIVAGHSYRSGPTTDRHHVSPPVTQTFSASSLSSVYPSVSPYLSINGGCSSRARRKRGAHLKPPNPSSVPLPIFSEKTARTSLTGLHAGVSFRSIAFGRRWLAGAPSCPIGPHSMFFVVLSVVLQGMASQFLFAGFSVLLHCATY